MIDVSKRGDSLIGDEFQPELSNWPNELTFFAVMKIIVDGIILIWITFPIFFLLVPVADDVPYGPLCFIPYNVLFEYLTRFIGKHFRLNVDDALNDILDDIDGLTDSEGHFHHFYERL